MVEYHTGLGRGLKFANFSFNGPITSPSNFFTTLTSS